MHIATHIGRFKIAALAAALIYAGSAYAAGSHSDEHDAGGHDAGEHGQAGGGALDFGMPGDPARADRTITVIMRDTEYNHPSISVKDGETIHFILRNEGELVHEFSIGMPEMHKAHQAEMIEMFEHGMMGATSINHAMTGKHSGMHHDEPNSVLLEPGQHAELTWTFGPAQQLEFACNIPGHYEMGMVGTFTRVE